MSKQNDVPAEVLIAIFKHLNPYQSFTQYQLTCKSWRLPAQEKSFKHAILRGPDQLEKFIKLLVDTGLGPIVERIDFAFDAKQPEPLQKIANLCPNLTGLGSNAYFPEIVYNVLEKERAKGNFSKLTSLYPDFYCCSMRGYYIGCSTLRDTLKELTIIDDEIPTFEAHIDTFPNLEMVRYVYSDSNSLYEIDQDLKNSSDRLRSVVIYLPQVPVPEWEPNTDHKILSHPNVKKLTVQNFAGTSNVFTYLMKVFPNLDEFDMNFDFEFSCNNSFEDQPILGKMTTIASVSFLQYVTQMSLFNVTYIPINDPLTVIKYLHDKTGKIKNLEINIQEGFKGYQSNMIVRNIDRKRMINASPILPKGEKTVFILSGNPKKPFAPIGFIEKSGEGLESLEVNMTGYSKCNNNNLIRYTSDLDYHLSNILKKCPNLNDLHIISTVLCKFGCRSPPIQKYRFDKSLKFSYSLFDPTFLSSLSLHVSYIHVLKIDKCEIADSKNPTILTIDMPHTKFDSIEYTGNTIPLGKKIFLKAESVEDKKTGYYLDFSKVDYNSWGKYGYVPPDVHFSTSTESEYEASFAMDNCLSVFIKCQNFNLIKLGNDAQSLVLEKVNH